MIKCVEAGHEIVALANLHPPPDTEELDSYMYQSVGHDAIEAYAAAMALPLYRAPITGTPRNVDFAYVPTEADEVEDLYELLGQVKRDHPDLGGVSSGAILSSYQKNRVECVCARLGLESLAYLWQAEQRSLLQSMIDAHLHAIIIKVAVYGLDNGDLGKSLSELQPKLLSLVPVPRVRMSSHPSFLLARLTSLALTSVARVASLNRSPWTVRSSRSDSSCTTRG